jgi:hypothetical protein
LVEVEQVPTARVLAVAGPGHMFLCNRLTYKRGHKQSLLALVVLVLLHH